MPMIRMMLAAMLNATAAVEVRIWWTLVADRWWRIVVCMRLLVRHCIASRLGLHRWKICHRIEIFAMRLVFVASFAMCVRLRSGRPSDWMQKATWNIVVMWRRKRLKFYLDLFGFTAPGLHAPLLPYVFGNCLFISDMWYWYSRNWSRQLTKASLWLAELIIWSIVWITCWSHGWFKIGNWFEIDNMELYAANRNSW